MTVDTLHLILLIALIELALVSSFLLWRRLASTRRLGRGVQATAPRQGWRKRLLALVWLAAAAFWLPGLGADAADPSFRLPAFALLFGGAVILLLSPRPVARVLGTTGVQSGWDTARFDALVEWRLSGEHLRFRLEGRLWDAVDAAPQTHAELRERLDRDAPGRESRYAE
jgi:hypothetical protein